ncbi:MAG: ADP-ribosylglycohydrolase family protein, partial [Anaerolineaceae bacterium]
AFIEPDIQQLIETGLALIPRDSVLYRMIQDVRGWHAGEPDWHRARAKIAQAYGYDRYKGVCHMIPNHAVILLGLLYGQGDFHRSMSVVNTAGWDTDCNAGNLGCLLGIRGGLNALTGGPDWLSPLADRLFLVSAEGGEVITDALRSAGEVVNTARALRGLPGWEPKDGARFHFEAPGAVQGFRAQAQAGQTAQIKNTAGHSRAGSRSLALAWTGEQAAALTPVFILPEEREISWYVFLASPALYSGQTLRAAVTAE